MTDPAAPGEPAETETAALQPAETAAVPASPDEPAETAAMKPAGAAPEPAGVPREPRPIIERLGLAAVAMVLALLFGGVAAASWVGGEAFLAVMAGVGCLMTVWVGILTLVRG